MGGSSSALPRSAAVHHPFPHCRSPNTGSKSAAVHHPFHHFRSPNTGSSKFDARVMSTINSPPYLMLPPTFEGGNTVYNLYSPADNKVVRQVGHEEFSKDVKFVGSSHGWLASFNQRNNDLFLFDPFSGRRIKLPPIDELPDPKVNLRLGGRGSVSKVIISCSPDEEEEEECQAMMSFGPGDRLAFCLPGRSTEWRPIGQLFFHIEQEGEPCYRHGRAYEDFVYCCSRRKKLFHCVTELELDLVEFKLKFPSELEYWDLYDLRPPRSRVCHFLRWFEFDAAASSPWLFENRNLFKNCRQIPYLVYAEKQDRLFLLIRFVLQGLGCDGPYVEETAYDPLTGGPIDNYTYRTIGFCAIEVVYDEKGSLIDKLRLVDDDGCPFDGLAMFVGSNHSFAMSAVECPGLKPNSIYFTDSNKHYTPDGSVYGGHDIGIFDYQNKTMSSCHYPYEAQSRKKNGPPPIWFTPRIY